MASFLINCFYMHLLYSNILPNITFCILLPHICFYSWPLGIEWPTAYLFPKEDYFFCSQNSLVASISLCGVTHLGLFPCSLVCLLMLSCSVYVNAIVIVRLLRVYQPYVFCLLKTLLSFIAHFLIFSCIHLTFLEVGNILLSFWNIYLLGWQFPLLWISLFKEIPFAEC